MHTRSDGRLFNPERLKEKSKVQKITLRDMLFADYAAQDLLTLLNKFSSPCSDFGVTISLKKTKVLSQEKNIPPTIKIDDKYIENLKTLYILAQVLCQRHQ